jgi:hypothetical protein
MVDEIQLTLSPFADRSPSKRLLFNAHIRPFSQLKPMSSSGSRSPRSVSSRSSSPPLTLDPSTLALLDSFLKDKAEEEEKFAQLAKRSLNLEGQEGVEGGEGLGEDAGEEKMMSVDEFRNVFGTSSFP